MTLAIAGILLLALIFLPTLRVRQVMKRHAVQRADIPSTGRGFARHLLDQAGLEDVKVELTKDGDHYDPATRTVRLSPENYKARSLTAVTIAAHEVAHAMQHAEGYKPLLARTRMAGVANNVQKIGSVVLMASPVVAVVTKAPLLVLLEVSAGLAIMTCSVLIHAVTLPVEFNASFARALPLLKGGNYLKDADIPAAREVLKAAAYTYVASALRSLVDVARWFRMLRF